MYKRMVNSLLAAVLLLTLISPAMAASDQIPSSLIVDGEEFYPAVCLFENENYYRVRDIAALLSGTASEFDVDYDPNTDTVLLETGSSYACLDSDLSAVDGVGYGVESPQTIQIDGRAVSLTARNVDGSNYIRLRDLSELLQFSVAWNDTVGIPEISTLKARAEDCITVFFTTDVHGNIDGDLSYAEIAEMKDTIEEAGEQVLLLDAGDHLQGTVYGKLDEGETLVQLMNAAGYDASAVGNHEFDYGTSRFLELTEQAEYPYLSCNFYELSDRGRGEKVLADLTCFDLDGLKIAVVGVSTPESLSQSRPTNFQNSDGVQVYDFTAGEELYSDVQAALDEANEIADFVIVLGHLGNEENSGENMSASVIQNTHGADVWIDGHSHDLVEKSYVENDRGDPVLVAQAGTAFGEIGMLTISYDGTADVCMISSYNDSDDEVRDLQNAWLEEVDRLQGETIAESEIEFRISDSEEDENGNHQRMVRSGETNLGDLTADALYWYFNTVDDTDCDAAFINGGDIRSDIDAGAWNGKTCGTVHPFGNTCCVVKMTGESILKALDFSTAFVGISEFGGYLQTAGLMFDLDASIEGTAVINENGTHVPGELSGRVSNVRIYCKETASWEPLDPEQTYNVAGIDFNLLQGGDGYNMFDDIVIVREKEIEDCQCLSAYLQAFEDSDHNGIANISSAACPLAAWENYSIDYESWQGAGRVRRIDME